VQYAAAHFGVDAHEFQAFEETFACSGAGEASSVRGLPVPIIRETVHQIAAYGTERDRVWFATRLMQGLEEVRGSAIVGSVAPHALFSEVMRVVSDDCTHLLMRPTRDEWATFFAGPDNEVYDAGSADFREAAASEWPQLNATLRPTAALDDVWQENVLSMFIAQSSQRVGGFAPDSDD
jgi:hypothetical protein